jgi:hypothetical protein
LRVAFTLQTIFLKLSDLLHAFNSLIGREFFLGAQLTLLGIHAIVGE